MFIKYQHARNGGILALVGGAVAGIAINAGDEHAPARHFDVEPPPLTQPATTAAPHATKPLAPATKASTPTSAPVSRPSDAAVIALASKASGGAKKAKDALGSASAWKVNLYDDNQDGRWDRLKIDRDRDGTWDSKWSFKGGLWEDGGANTVWREGRWASRDSAPAGGRAESSVSLKVAAAMGQRASAKKIKDFYRGSGPKVNLYDDQNDGVWDRAKIDLDRDGTWDEKLSRKSGGIERKVEASGAVFVLSGDAWKKK